MGGNVLSRLVVVSNRVAPIDEGKQSAGGLAVAVLAALKKTGGIWFGWSGEVVAAPPSAPMLSTAQATIDCSLLSSDSAAESAGGECKMWAGTRRV